MKISEKIDKVLESMTQTRLDKLNAMGRAPQVILDTLTTEIETGNMSAKVGKIKKYGHLEFVSLTPKDYRRGTGCDFKLEDDSIIHFIPGPHGWFLTN